jgi:hypothetical protein
MPPERRRPVLLYGVFQKSIKLIDKPQNALKMADSTDFFTVIKKTGNQPNP